MIYIYVSSSFQLLEHVRLDSTGRLLPVSLAVSGHTNRLRDRASALPAPTEAQPPQQDSQLCLGAAVRLQNCSYLTVKHCWGQYFYTHKTMIYNVKPRRPCFVNISILKLNQGFFMGDESKLLGSTE